MRSSSERINISTVAQKLDVDNRYTLRFYNRVADNVLKQADIFRAEGNIIDLYVMLLRFSSLVTETIPCHRDYRASPQTRKVFLKKKLLLALEELEVLKPAVRQKVDELNKKHTNSNSLEWPLVKNQTVSNYDARKAVRPPVRGYAYQGSMNQQYSYSRPVEEQLGRSSLIMYRPKEETLSKHSILGPSGLYGQWQPPKSDKGVRYPSNIDLSPIEMPRLQISLEDEVSSKKDYGNLEPQKPDAEPILIPDEDSQIRRAKEPDSMISFENEPTETLVQPEIIRQPSPPPVLAEVQDLIPTTSPQVAETNCASESPLLDGFGGSESPLQLHISTTMMENFMKLAKSNTDKNLETCGILAGTLKNRKFYITALIIPKQESTSDSCQATNEEEIFEVQDKLSLLPLGWIHTHPTQSCFMSSIDVHTHYSYQIMLPESVAIVMAPKDSSRTHGIFRLTTPGGMSVIRHCQQRGFHPHSPPPDGGPLYKSCTDVYMNPNIKFDVHDLR